MAAAVSARTSGDGSWMSGATSAVPPGGAIQARQRRVPWRTASAGWARPSAYAPQVLAADGDEGVAGVLLERGLCEQLDERPLGPRLPEPAEGDGGRAAVARLVVAQRRQQVVDEVLAPEGRLHLGIEALAAGRGSLLDRHHRVDRQVANGGVGVVEVGDEVLQRVASRDAAEGLENGSAQQLVTEQLEERRRRRAGRRSRRGR